MINGSDSSLLSWLFADVMEKAEVEGWRVDSMIGRRNGIEYLRQNIMCARIADAVCDWKEIESRGLVSIT